MGVRQHNDHLSVNSIVMPVLLSLLIIGAVVYYFYKDRKKPSENPAQTVNSTNTESPEKTVTPQIQQNPNHPKHTKKSVNQETQKRQQMFNQVIWDDGVRKLFFADNTPKLIYKGTEYHFSGHGYEPMTIILDKGGEVAYIHNSFLVDEECKEFVKNPKYLCCTITGHKHNAKHFCMLLTTAIDYGYDWQINDLESKMFSLERFAQREVFYNADGIEFGIYGHEIEDDSAEPDDEPKTHFEYDIIYIIVDGKKYRLEDANMDHIGQLGIFEMGKRKPKIRINGTKGSVIAAYTDEWRSGETFTPFGRPCDTKTFCEMMAYAIREGKQEYSFEKLENAIKTIQ